MARVAPTMKPWRVKRGRKYIGAWHVTVDGERINLRTKDARLAEKRAREAKRGRRDFESDTEGAAATTIAALDGAGSGGATVDPPPPPVAPPVEEHTPPPPDPPPAAGGPPVDAGNWAADAAAAAGEQASDPLSEEIDPEIVDGLFRDAATAIVEAQIRLQAWTWRRYKNIEVSPVPPDHPSRERPTKLWDRQLRKWVPTEKIAKLAPDWAQAIGYTLANTTPVQLEGAQPIKDEPAPPDAEIVDDGKAA